MSDERSSNPLVHELREMARQLEIEVSASMADDVVQAAYEIERLTANLEAGAASYKRMKDERDLLVQSAHAAMAQRDEAYKEVHRLRAALEHNKKHHAEYHQYCSATVYGAPGEPDGYSHTASGGTVGHSHPESAGAGGDNHPLNPGTDPCGAKPP